MNNKTVNGLRNGSTLGGRFKIMRLIGQGGMAYVYLAQDQKSGRRVAVKVLKQELSNDAEFVQRFDTEARAASSLNHPNIVKVLGVGEENGLRYMIQEYIEGSTLKDMIDHYGRIDWRVAVPIGMQVALALEHAHEAGVIHRDIKPHNIMITPEQKAMVTDFGIARAGSSNTITLTGGNAMGSVHYFSPEQARGGIVGQGADIYSLGIVFYEMLTGDVPFDGETSVAVAIKHLQETPEPVINLVPDVPKGLSDIVMKCLQKSPVRRYRSARELIDELTAFLADPSGEYGVVSSAEELEDTTAGTPALRKEENYDKLSIMSDQLRSRKSTRKKEIGIMITVVLLGLAAVFFIAWRLISTFTPEAVDGGNKKYKISNYISQHIDDVSKRFSRDGFKAYRIKYEPSTDFAEGIIFEQDPPEGTLMNKDGIEKLVLTVSSGADVLKLPDYTGFNYTDAVREITSMNNWQTEVKFEKNDKVEANQVIRTDPPASSIVPEGGKITLYVSQGKPDKELPDLLNQPYTQAKKTLEKMGLKPYATVRSGEANPPESELIVVEMDPQPGTRVQSGSPVNLIVSTWNDINPTAEPSTTPAETPPTTEAPPTEPPATEPTETQPTNTQHTESEPTQSHG